jgi:DNA-binding SARP family transcriptional activator
LELSSEVDVDLYEANRSARSVIDGGSSESSAHGSILLLDPRMTSDLLPGWYDEWVLAERERHRQLTLHALELLCTSMTGDGRYADAVLAGLAAINQEPLRESSHRALIGAHLAADNAGEALRCYERYRELAAEALGVEPSSTMKALVSRLGSTR